MAAPSFRATLGRNRAQNPADGENEENGEIDQAGAHRDPEKNDLPVENLRECGATVAKQGEELFLVVWRRHKIVGADRPFDKKRKARRDYEAGYIARINRMIANRGSSGNKSSGT